MKKVALPFFVFLMRAFTSNLAAQNIQLSASGTYGVVLDQFQNKNFNAIGLSLWHESKIDNHVTLGADIDWQCLETEPAIAEPYSSNSGLPNLTYTIDRHQFNIRPTIRYYFKKTFQGFYTGVFATYSSLKIKDSNYPQLASYNPKSHKAPSYDTYFGGGFTYGFRLKLTESLHASAFGSHQFALTFWTDRKQQDHQLGLGLNWTIKSLKKRLH